LLRFGWFCVDQQLFFIMTLNDNKRCEDAFDVVAAS